MYSMSLTTGVVSQLADFEQDIDGPLTEHEGIVYIHTQDDSLQRINAANGAILGSIFLESQ